MTATTPPTALLHARDFPQQLVANSVAKRIVDVFESVEVEKQQTHAMMRPPAPLQRHPDFCKPGEEIPQPRPE